jgi:hypothetical protein
MHLQNQPSTIRRAHNVLIDEMYFGGRDPAACRTVLCFNI